MADLRERGGGCSTGLADRSSGDPGAGECSGCPNAHACRDVWGAKNKGPLAPVGLTLGSAAAFLLPLVTAAVCGGVAHVMIEQDAAFPVWDMLAAAVGLALGAMLGWVVMPWIGRRWKREGQG